MKTITLREFQQKGSTFIKELPVAVTVYGKVVAHIVPPGTTISPENTNTGVSSVHRVVEETKGQSLSEFLKANPTSEKWVPGTKSKGFTKHGKSYCPHGILVGACKKCGVV